MKRIAFVTDTHLDEDFPKGQKFRSSVNFIKLVDHIKSQGIEEIIFGGDIGEPDRLPLFFEALSAFKFKVILGNHDNINDLRAYYPTTSASLYYSYDEEGYRYVFLDSSSGLITEEQVEWLLERCSTDFRLLVFVHHPVLAVNTVVDKKYPLQNRNRIRDILRTYNGSVMLFCGHYHLSHLQQSGNITQIISPACSYQIKQDPDEVITDTSSFGYRVIEIRESGVTSELWMYADNEFRLLASEGE